MTIGVVTGTKRRLLAETTGLIETAEEGDQVAGARTGYGCDSDTVWPRQHFPFTLADEYSLCSVFAAHRKVTYSGPYALLLTYEIGPMFNNRDMRIV